MSIENRQIKRTAHLKRAISLWLPVLLMMALTYWLSDQPNLSSGLGVWDLIGRKILHMVEFGVLTALLYRASQDSFDTIKSRLVFAVLVAIAYAISDEFHQNYVYGRHASPVDVLIDSAGVGTAAVVISVRTK